MPRPRQSDRNAPPSIIPAQPEKPPQNLIEIPLVRPAAGQAQARPSRSREYWKNYYRTHDESAAQLKETITLLNRSQKFQEVYEALLGYLTHRGVNREPWMYEAMALAIKMNKGKPEDVKTTLGYAADMALETRNPNDLVSVADLLFLNKSYERVGTLLDLAAEKVPHRSEPLIMSINLARVTKDPKRMGDTVVKLLELGWPGDDDRIRLEARQQAESLARTLHEEGRDDEAEALLARLPEAEARDLFVRLSWVGDADLDLVVEEPLGATARYQTPRTVFGGSILKNGYGRHPEEVYVCPRAFDGNYTIRVETIAADPARPVTQATLETILHEGAPDEQRQVRTIKLGLATTPVVVTLMGGRRKTALPFLAPAWEVVKNPAKRKDKPVPPAASKGSRP